MRKLYKGEKRYIGVEVQRRDGATFTLGTSTYEVYAPAGTAVDTGSATVEGSTVFFLCDTTKEAYAGGSQYRAYIQTMVDGLPKVLREMIVVEVTP